MTDPDDGWRTAEELRRMFNARGFVDRVREGTLTTLVTQHKETHSVWSPVPLYRQIVRYYDGRERVAVVSQWLHLDGTPAASGLPDPKRIVVDGKEYWTGEYRDRL